MEQNLKYWCSHGDPGNLSISNEMTPPGYPKENTERYIFQKFLPLILNKELKLSKCIQWVYLINFSTFYDILTQCVIAAVSIVQPAAKKLG